ncbi:MAG TPA: hypothetical protein VGH73_06240 [Thermoanaerobaculia bacterium]|jgi:hypothetical protein
MSSRFRVELLLLLCLLAAVPAAASWQVNGDATGADFRAFNRRFSSDAYFFPRHGAAPLGLVGFEAYADATYDRSFDDQSFNKTAVTGDYTGGFLSIARVGLRKGLPGGVDLGVSYGKALGGDVNLLSAEIQYAVVSGGLLSPALSVRVTGTRTMNRKAYGLDQYGAELLLSKGFPVVTPYVGVGVVHSRGTLDSPLGLAREDTATRPVAFAGVTLSLLIPKIHIEIERGDALQAAVRVGIGF